jgi:hypothetical protein
MVVAGIHIPHMEMMKKAYEFQTKDLKERGSLRDLRVDGRTILKWFYINIMRGKTWIKLCQNKFHWSATLDKVLKIPSLKTTVY